jgi:hypothetical protein
VLEDLVTIILSTVSRPVKALDAVLEARSRSRAMARLVEELLADREGASSGPRY